MLSHWLRSHAKRWTYLLEIPPTGFDDSLHTPPKLNIWLSAFAAKKLSISVLFCAIPVSHKLSRRLSLCLGNLLKLVPFRTNLMVTDALTKRLPASGLERHRSVMMGHSDFQVRLLHAVRGG